LLLLFILKRKTKQSLQFDVFEATQRLSSLRRSLSHLDTRVCATALAVPRLSRRLHSLTRLHSLSLCFQRAVQGRALAAALLQNEDYFSAQEVLIAVRRVVDKEQLQHLSAMQTVWQSLCEMETMVYTVLCNQFVSTGIAWEDESCTADTASAAAVSGLDEEGLESISHPNYQLLQPQQLPSGSVRTDESTLSAMLSSSLCSSAGCGAQQQQVLQLLTALHSGDKLNNALAMYKDRLTDAVKLVIRTCITEFIGDDYHDPNGNGNGDEVQLVDALGSLDKEKQRDRDRERVRDMPVRRFLDCLSMSVEHVLLALRRARVFHEHVVAALQSMSAQSSSSLSASLSLPLSNSMQESDNLILNNNNNNGSDHDNEGDESLLRPLTSAQATDNIVLSQQALSAACEIAQKALAQFLNSRRQENTAKFEIADMQKLWLLCQRAARDIESLSQSSPFVLLQSVLRLSRSFLEELHKANKQKLVNCLEHERWTQCDVNAERQREIDRLASGRAALSVSSTAPTTPTAVATAAGLMNGASSVNNVVSPISLSLSQI
jgi:hypothetical protein